MGILPTEMPLFDIETAGRVRFDLAAENVGLVATTAAASTPVVADSTDLAVVAGSIFLGVHVVFFGVGALVYFTVF